MLTLTRTRVITRSRRRSPTAQAHRRPSRSRPVVVADQPVVVTPVPVSAAVGVPTGNVLVATFTDPEGADPVSDYSASILVQDPVAATGTITYDAVDRRFLGVRRPDVRPGGKPKRSRSRSATWTLSRPRSSLRDGVARLLPPRCWQRLRAWSTARPPRGLRRSPATRRRRAP